MEKANQIKEELKVIFAEIDGTLRTIDKEDEKIIANLAAWENLKSEIMSQDDNSLFKNFREILTIIEEEQNYLEDGANDEYIRKSKGSVVKSYGQKNKFKISKIFIHSSKILFPSM